MPAVNAVNAVLFNKSKYFNGFNGFNGKIQENNLESSPKRDTVSFGNAQSEISADLCKFLKKPFPKTNFSNVENKIVSNEFYPFHDIENFRHTFDKEKAGLANELKKVTDFRKFIRKANEYSQADSLYYLGGEPNFKMQEHGKKLIVTSPFAFQRSNEAKIGNELISDEIIEKLETIFADKDKIVIKNGKTAYSIKALKNNTNPKAMTYIEGIVIKEIPQSATKTTQ